MMQSDLGRKSTVYFSALLLNAVLGIVVYIMLVRSMDTVSFGTYSFVIAVFLFTGMFFDFGLAPAGMRLMALQQSDRDASRRIGALLLLSAGIGVVFAVVMAGASFAVDAIWQKNVGGILLAASPFALVYPLQEMVLSISQGSNRMKFMSVFLVLPRVLLIAILAAMILSGGLDARMAVIATLATLGVAIGIAAGYLRPVFSDLGEEFRFIVREVKEFGAQVYLGRVVDGMTTGLDKILLAKFHGMAPVGFYSIAMTMSTPISMFSKAVSQSAYKRFVSDEGIARRLLLINLTWCTMGAALLLAACQLLIPLFFGARYAESLTVLPWLMAGFALAGLNHPYHAFLAARRQGRSIRIMSIASSAVNIVLNLTLIPLLAMTGAAIAFIATYAVNILMNLHFYRTFRREAAAAEQADGSVHG
ncbi:MAG: oligosaccharide flippase family protein [Bacteroidetes bacterium]|nr:oligosaccharide flippase family protein [Bacteroidota bacterium]